MSPWRLRHRVPGLRGSNGWAHPRTVFPFSSLSPDLRLSPLLPILDIRKTHLLYTLTVAFIFAWLCFYICVVPWEKDYQLPGSFHFQGHRAATLLTVSKPKISADELMFPISKYMYAQSGRNGQILLRLNQ